MKNQNCAYCMENELLDPFGIKICDLPASMVYLFKEQSHEGRVIVAYKDHVSEMIELTDDERNAFFADVNHVAKAIHAAFSPQKVNYGAYGDTSGHLHFHLVPKYTDQFEWNTIFAMNPNLKYLSDAEYSEIIKKIKAAL